MGYGQWRAHVLLRPEGHDAGHHRDARGRLGQEGPRLGGEAQAVEEGWAVACGGLLSGLPAACDLALVNDFARYQRPNTTETSSPQPLLRCVIQVPLLAFAACGRIQSVR